MKRARKFPAVWETRGKIPVYAAAGGGENNNVISVFNLVVPIFCRCPRLRRSGLCAIMQMVVVPFSSHTSFSFLQGRRLIRGGGSAFPVPGSSAGLSKDWVKIG